MDRRSNLQRRLGLLRYQPEPGLAAKCGEIDGGAPVAPASKRRSVRELRGSESLQFPTVIPASRFWKKSVDPLSHFSDASFVRAF